MMNDQLAIWNNTQAEYLHDKPLHEWIEEQAIRFAGKEAIRFAGKGITYAQLNESANRLAYVLLSNGIQTGDSVGLLLDRSPDMIIALLAILKSGAAYIPLDPDYPQQRIIYMLENAGARILLTQKKYSGHFPSSATELLLEDALERSKDFSIGNPAKKISGNDLAYIIYTSGSTGKPKGVMVEHHSVVNLLLHLLHIQIIKENDKLLAITTISFDIAALELFLPLLAGAQVVLTEAKVSRDGFSLLELIRAENISIMQATPVTWKIMLAAGWEDKTNLTILCCGEALSMDLAMKLIPRSERLFNYYGPTETTIYSTGTQIFSTDTVITIGTPVANTQVYILDEKLQPVAVGEEGELYIGGDGVARGYIHTPGLTEQRFVKDPFAKEERTMFRTGDLGKWQNDGTIHLLGRIDQQIKIRGYRIEPGEIESCLSSEPDIKDTVAIAREDTPGNKTLVVYIVPAKQEADPSAQIRRWKKALQNCMPDFMIPNEYVVLPQLPLLPNGKVNRNGLPRPDKRLHTTVAASVDTDTEKMVSHVWADVLGLDHVGLDENFFDLGGHSLIAVQMMMELEKATGKRLPIAALFEAPTVRALSHFIQSGNLNLLWEALVPVKPSGTKPPLYIVHGDGLNVMVFNSIPKYMDADQPVFGLQPKGLNGIDQPDESMEEIAAYYISGILKHNPHGPYFLAGYSFGGIVAFEMAKQLSDAGRDVKMIAMFDTNVGNINYTGPLMKRIWKKISIQFPKMLFIANSLTKYPKSIIDYQWFVVKRKWRTLLRKLKLAPDDEQDKIPPHETRIIEKHFAAYKNYNMTAYDGKIDLFRVQKRVYFLDDPIYLGWKSLAKKGVSIHEMPGDHRTFLLPPNDKIFAGLLQSVINERAKEK